MKKISVILLCAVTLWMSWSCGEDPIRGCTDPRGINYNPNATENNSACIYPRDLSQIQVDGASILYRSNLTGVFRDSTGLTVSYSHAESVSDPNNTIREIYTTYRLPGNKVNIGLVSVLHVYEKNLSGQKGKRLGVYAMHKQVNGYYNDGKDWEYLNIDPASVKPPQNNNGILPPENSAQRGKINNCASCHSRSNSGLFTFSQ